MGTQNAYNLMSVSTDGKMCSWSLDMLSQPQDSIELNVSDVTTAHPIIVISVSLC